MNLFRVPASLLAITAIAAPAISQGNPFKNALPAGTLAFFSAPDLNTSIGEFQNTALAKMWREGEVQEFLADAQKMGLQQWTQQLGQLKQMHKDGQFPIDPEDLLKLRMNSMSGALTSIAIKPGDNKPEPKIGVALHMDFGASAPTWRKLINMGLQAFMGQTQGMFQRSESKLDGDIQMITLTPPETDMTLNVAFVGTGVVIGTIQSEVKAICSSLVTKQAVFPASSVYKATAANLDTAGAEMEVFMNVAGLMDFAMNTLKMAEKEAPNWPEQLSASGIDRALTALGLRSVRAVGMTSRYEGAKCVTRSFALSPEGARKGIFAGGGNNLDLNFLKWVPKDASSVSASTMSMGSIYDSIVGAVKAYNPDMADQMLGMLAEQEKQMGLSLKDDLFGAFGDQMVWWSMGLQNFMSAPEGAMLMKVKDQDRLLKTLNTMAKMSQGMIEFPATERKGIKTWRLELNAENLPPEAGQAISAMMSTLQPCFAFKNGYMVMALATSDVRRAFKRMDREDVPKGDIRSNKEFSTYVAGIAQQQVSSFAWTDWKVSFENIYTAATSVLGFLDSEQVPVDLTLLPEAETLSQHLFSAASWTTTSKDGMSSKSVGPVGPEVMLGAVIIGVTVAGVVGARFGGNMAPRPVMVQEAEPAAPRKGK